MTLSYNLLHHFVMLNFSDMYIVSSIGSKPSFFKIQEFGSEGMFEAIASESKTGGFLNDVDFFCISDNYWL